MALGLTHGVGAGSYANGTNDSYEVVMNLSVLKHRERIHNPANIYLIKIIRRTFCQEPAWIR
jgi:hypothetical protein